MPINLGTLEGDSGSDSPGYELSPRQYRYSPGEKKTSSFRNLAPSIEVGFQHCSSPNSQAPSPSGRLQFASHLPGDITQKQLHQNAGLSPPKVASLIKVHFLSIAHSLKSTGHLIRSGFTGGPPVYSAELGQPIYLDGMSSTDTRVSCPISGCRRTPSIAPIDLSDAPINHDFTPYHLPDSALDFALLRVQRLEKGGSRRAPPILARFRMRCPIPIGRVVTTFRRGSSIDRRPASLSLCHLLLLHGTRWL
eukprot:3250386-Rhodomonas_salina.1